LLDDDIAMAELVVMLYAVRPVSARRALIAALGAPSTTSPRQPRLLYPRNVAHVLATKEAAIFLKIDENTI
jgi:hypothetical protein